jgi:hypothetical protein
MALKLSFWRLQLLTVIDGHALGWANEPKLLAATELISALEQVRARLAVLLCWLVHRAVILFIVLLLIAPPPLL